jgi:NADPH-dependent glutamate synthase beta subunit-like oxidoreductase/NAD-dependent dihydropyrimidine dehydrogenase PreA subunit
MRGFPPACTTRVSDGMNVQTNTEELKKFRKNILWLTLSEYPEEMIESTQMKKVADWIGAEDILSDFKKKPADLPIMKDDPLFIRDMNRCILCGRCVRMCREKRGIGAIGLVNRGINTIVGTNFDVPMTESGCKFCEACVEVCPSGALVDKVNFEGEGRDREGTIVPCRYGCPAHVDIPRYARLTGQGRFQDAIEVIRSKLPFAHVLGTVCEHPCETDCRRGNVNQPISIREIKRFVAERDNERWRKKVTVKPDTGKKAAIIGSGPAGLTAAWFIRKQGHAVTVFEKLTQPGGMMRAGIPKYRLPRSILDKEIKYITDIGVQIKTDTMIDSLDEIFSRGFDAVFVAIGSMGSASLRIDGENDPRVLDGIELLRNINFDEDTDITGDVVVIGGGNVAMDVARSSLRKGVRSVTILYRRTRNEMPAEKEEIEEAINEGVKMRFLAAPSRVITDGKKLQVECVTMKLGEPDASGRRRPVPVKGKEFILKADRLVTAIGQKPDIPEGFGLETDERGNIKAHPDTLAASREGVYSGGDIVTGPASVVKASRAGRVAASSIDKFLGNDGDVVQNYIPDDEFDPFLGREEDFAGRQRAVNEYLAVEKRFNGLPQVEFTLKEKDAVEEGKRCLQCQLRLAICKAPFPPE